jgi:MFS family permease
VFTQFNSTLPLQIRAHGFPNSLYGIMMSINGLMVLIFELPISSFTRRRPAPRIMALGLLLIGLGFSLTGANASPIALIVAVIVWTSGEIVFVPVAAAYVADIAPGDMRGRYQGTWAGTWGLSNVLAPALGTALFAASPALLWSLCAVTGFTAAMIMLAAPARAPQ